MLGALGLCGAGVGFVAPQLTVVSSATRRPTAQTFGGTAAAGCAAATAAATATLLVSRRRVSARAEKLHGIKFPYSLQKDAYADLKFMNDVGPSDALRSCSRVSKSTSGLKEA